MSEWWQAVPVAGLCSMTSGVTWIGWGHRRWWSNSSSDDGAIRYPKLMVSLAQYQFADIDAVIRPSALRSITEEIGARALADSLIPGTEITVAGRWQAKRDQSELQFNIGRIGPQSAWPGFVSGWRIDQRLEVEASGAPVTSRPASSWQVKARSMRKPGETWADDECW
ncbi:hypothetical protein HJ588_03725 [Flexivirga sp. ID2601S]|uniref:Uncharacterized protein n=1 Tax=Flexivirga aerilata TaxID=1656889 RepID=A0A849ACZ4_9MICO|nr:hypothetical protein [Flexivirga aerilata]NNG38385.1 hypothetical protein [Flexivirga aerilata]